MISKNNGAAALPRGKRVTSVLINALEPRTLFSGGLDPTFGTGGYDLGAPQVTEPIYENATFALQSDGKLLMAVTDVAATGEYVDVVRFLGNGQVDPSFGVSGKTVLSAAQAASAITQLGNSKIDVLTTAGLYQLNSNGAVNTSFGSNGLTATTGYTLAADATGVLVGEQFAVVSVGSHVTAATTSLAGTQVRHVFFLPSGGFVASDASGSNVGSGAIYSFNANGSPNTVFASGGVYSGVASLTVQGVQPDGKLIVSTVTSTNDFRESTYSVFRLNTNGTVDPTFKTITSDADTFAIEKDGSILIGGFQPQGNGNISVSVAHYSADGVQLNLSPGIAPLETEYGNQLLPLPSGSYFFTGGSDSPVAVKLTGAGAVDESFGAGGALMSLYPAQPPLEYQSLAVQADRKLIAAATTFNGSTQVFDLTRYNVNGSVDTAFGVNGVVQTSFGNQLAQSISVLVQPDGKIIATGNIGDTAVSGEVVKTIAVVRYNSDGSVDTTFGKSGVITLNDSNPTPLLQNGQLIIGATKSVYRLTTAGAVDSTFTKPTGGQSFAVQTDGKILVSVIQFNAVPDTTTDTIYRYNVNGSIDTTFGNHGHIVELTTPFSLTSSALLEEADGTIVVADDLILPPPETFAEQLSAFNANGSVDTHFGTDGIVQSPSFQLYSGAVPSLLQQPDGKLLLIYDQGGFYTSPVAQIVRYSASGQIDTTFGTNGTAMVGSQITTGFRGSGPLGAGTVAVLDSQGRLIIGGGIESYPTAANLFAVDTNNDTGTITGYMFDDTNGNGVRDAGEGPLKWTCYIDVDNDGTYDNADIRIYTDSSGNFVIPNLAPGVYHIRQSGVAGWTKTTPAEYTVTVTAGETVTGVIFGSKPN